MKKAAKLTLGQLYTPSTVYSSRTSYTSNPWLEPDEHQSNFLTGRELLIADMPVIVHDASVTDKLETLFSLVDQKVPDNLYRFNSKETYESLIQRLARQEDKKIYFQYVHGDDVLSPMHYALDKGIFIALNNKSRIEEWTDGNFMPEREIVEIADVDARVKEWDFPFVLKPGDDLPTAGGYGVMICYNDEDLDKAIKRIHAAEDETDTIIIEQMIEAKENYCVQFAYSESLGVTYIGSAKQLTNAYGFYNGNVNAINVPEKVVEAGRKIMEIGVEKGFYGVAGFDLLEDHNGDVFAIDLNFRQNGSTSMLLLEPYLTKGYHKFYSYIAKGDNTKFFKAIQTFIKKGVLYPLSYYDGDWYQDRHVNSRFACIWHAETEEAVDAHEAAFLKAIE